MKMKNFNNEMVTWENAFAQYVKGLDEKNIKAIDEALKIMKQIDAELAAKIWAEDMIEVRSWRVLEDRLTTLDAGKMVMFSKDIESAKSFKDQAEATGRKVQIKNTFGKYAVKAC